MSMPRKPQYKLWLVIDEQPYPIPPLPYDLDNANPWPLGTYESEEDAIKARNAMVVVNE
jgi:hypothetical protein